MRPRPRKQTVADARGGLYFAQPTALSFIESGSTLLDCVLSGGYPLGRVVNIVGDKSTGKTLLAMEAVANFFRQYPQGMAWYNETESAFDLSYAKALGIPTDQLQMVDTCETVEDLFEHLGAQVEVAKKTKVPGLYIVDSLDALSDRTEMGNAIDKASYGASKAKQMSHLFRRLIGPIEEARVCLMVVSQVRDKIGVVFGRKTSRSGGRALDFYASQVLYLAHLKRLQMTRKGQTRVVGVRVKAHCDKNKVGLPFRECEFNIRFGYGVDDVSSCRDWLKDIKETETDDDDNGVKTLVKKRWREIDLEFLPTTGKYTTKQT